MVGFGASDCWTPAYIGKYWTSGRDRISELLFSSEIVDGQPKGIGLSMWRVNLGGGSAEQGDESGIVDKSRRAESYLTDNLSLDWTHCEGQRYFMSSAKGIYEGEGMLPTCVMGNMIWQANVVLNQPSQSQGAIFTFKTDK
jgi:hypothetical protein